MHYFAKYKINLIAIAFGAIGGYLYYHFIGCTSGTCPITSKPMNSTLYGAFLGNILVGLVKSEKQ
jgi:Family of unknown function (DUF6132)